MSFTTYDRDNDCHSLNYALWPGGATGGWWYNQCGGSWPNNQRDYRQLGILLRGKDGWTLPMACSTIYRDEDQA